MMTKGWDHYTQGKSVTERGYGHAWRKTRAQVQARAKGMCQSCIRAGKQVIGRECDHIKPKAHGGTDAMDNLQWLCSQCHEAKTARETHGGSIPLGCSTSGVPLDPSHHWAAGDGGH